MTRYKIGEVSRLLSITPQALRFYEQEGILTPLKSENGTRFYTEQQLVLLLCFKKYRVMGLSIRDIAGHFQGGSLPGLLKRLDEQADVLQKESERLLRLSAAVRAHAAWVRRIQEGVGRLERAVRPRALLHGVQLCDLQGAGAAGRESLHAWIEAMPAVSLIFTQLSALSSPPRWGFAAPPEGLPGLPLADCRALDPAPCVRTTLRTEGRPPDDGALRQLLAQARAQGFAIDPEGMILGRHAASETLDGDVFLYTEIWIELLKNKKPPHREQDSF